MDSSEIRAWETALQGLHERLGRWFKRAAVRERAYCYMSGLLSNVSRKKGWQLAEQAGDSRPDGMQRLLSSAVWDEARVRDEGCASVVEPLGAAEGVLVVDETGFLKKGSHSAGVKRQYSGRAGSIENCQVGVFLAYNSPKGHALIERALSLPKDWIADSLRREQAHVPAATQTFAKKATLGRHRLARAFAAHVPHPWVVGDCGDGADLELRQWLQSRKEGYVVGITRHHRLYYQGARQRLDEIAADLPSSAWQPCSCGAGTKGERLYDWALVQWHTLDAFEDERHAFIVRRNLLDPTDEAYCRVFAPAGTSLSVLAPVAGQRWTIEDCFELAKDELGLDPYEVRAWHGWLRHTTFFMLTLAFLAVLRHSANPPPLDKKTSIPRCLFVPSPKFAL